MSIAYLEILEKFLVMFGKSLVNGKVLAFHDPLMYTLLTIRSQ